MKSLFIASVAVLLGYQTNAMPVVEETRSEPNRGGLISAYQHGASQSTIRNSTDDGMLFPKTNIGQGPGLADQIAAWNVSLPERADESPLRGVLLFTGLTLSPVAGFVITRMIRHAIFCLRSEQRVADTAPHFDSTCWNREQYLSSLATTAKVFVSCGLITQKQADTIVSAATRSGWEKESRTVPRNKTLQPTTVLLLENSKDPTS